MQQQTHKLISVIIVAAATYFGFQALDLVSGIYQVQTYFAVAWYVFAFHVFWLLFVFDLHLKKPGHLARARERHVGLVMLWNALKSRARHFYSWAYVRHYFNYLILPSVFYWSVVVLMHLNPFHELFKDGMIVTVTAALSVVYWYFKDAISSNMEHTHTGLKVLALAKLLAAFLGLTSIIALGIYYELPVTVVIPASFLLTAVLVYQGLFQHKLLTGKALAPLLMVSTLVCLASVAIYQNWSVNYYTAGLMAVIIYNTAWGITHKHLEGTLTKRLAGEYIALLIVLVSIVLSTHDFGGKI